MDREFGGETICKYGFHLDINPSFTMSHVLAPRSHFTRKNDCRVIFKIF